MPNLECNILCGNSLIDEFAGIRLINDSVLLGNTEYQIHGNQDLFESTLRALIDAQDELFRCDNTDKKEELKGRITGLRDVIIMSQLDGASEETLAAYNATKDKASKPYVLWQLDFARVFREKGGFDIVIGNPPYIRSYKNQFRTMTKIQLNLATYMRVFTSQHLQKQEIFIACFTKNALTCYGKWEPLAFITSNKWMRAGYGKN